MRLQKVVLLPEHRKLVARVYSLDTQLCAQQQLPKSHSLGATLKFGGLAAIVHEHEARGSLF